jgi:hypothetical protein
MEPPRGPRLPPARRRGAPIKYPRPEDCPHPPAPEHAFGSCRACTRLIYDRTKRNTNTYLLEKIKSLEERLEKQEKGELEGKLFFVEYFLIILKNS